MSSGATNEQGCRWWLRYVIVPIIGSGGVIAIIVALIPILLRSTDTSRSIEVVPTNTSTIEAIPINAPTIEVVPTNTPSIEVVPTNTPTIEIVPTSTPNIESVIVNTPVLFDEIQSEDTSKIVAQIMQLGGDFSISSDAEFTDYVYSILNDDSLREEDKIFLIFFPAVRRMDMEILSQVEYIDSLPPSSPSIDVEKQKLKRMVDKRDELFDMHRQIVEK